MTAPNRSREQRMNALDNANTIRTYRRDLKKDIKAGKISIVSLLTAPPDEIVTMKLSILLLATPKIGQTKANRILARCRISPTKTVGGLSDRQRSEIISLLYRR